jgi:hypothetical protein
MSDESTKEPTSVGIWMGRMAVLMLAVFLGMPLGAILIPRRTLSPPPAAPAPTMDVHDLFKECLRAAYRNGANQNDCVAIYYGPDQ